LKSSRNLVFLRFSSLGDVAISIPLIRCVLSSYPKINITFVTKKKFTPLFDEFKNLNILELDSSGRHSGFNGLLTLFSDIKKLDPIGIVDLHGSLRTNFLKFFFFFSSIRYKKIHKGRIEKRLLTRKKNKVLVPLTPTIHRYSDVLRKIGFPVDLCDHEFPLKPITPKKFNNSFFNSKLKWIGIAPFAKHLGKIYPLDLTQKVISFLQIENQVFLFGADGDEANKLEVWERAYSNVYSLAGKFSLSDEIKIISNLDLMISMDSANGHIATNYNIPVITIWGVTHPYAGFSPWNQNPHRSILADRSLYPLIPTSVYGNSCPRGYENCMRTITPEKILEVAKRTIY
jgi:ADP-heptose:LPS heptosyltransferase